jgi:hypothetical protein
MRRRIRENFILFYSLKKRKKERGVNTPRRAAGREIDLGTSLVVVG